MQVLFLVRSNDPPPLPQHCKFSKVIYINYLYTYDNNTRVQLYGGHNKMSYPNNSMNPGNYSIKMVACGIKVLETILILENGNIIMVVNVYSSF